MSINQFHRLYASMIGYRRTFEEMAFKASNAAQDMNLLMSELEQLIQQKEINDDESTSGCDIIDDDNHIVSGC